MGAGPDISFFTALKKALRSALERLRISRRLQKAAQDPLGLGPVMVPFLLVLFPFVVPLLLIVLLEPGDVLVLLVGADGLVVLACGSEAEGSGTGSNSNSDLVGTCFDSGSGSNSGSGSDLAGSSFVSLGIPEKGAVIPVGRSSAMSVEGVSDLSDGIWAYKTPHSVSKRIGFIEKKGGKVVLYEKRKLLWRCHGNDFRLASAP